MLRKTQNLNMNETCSIQSQKSYLGPIFLAIIETIVNRSFLFCQTSFISRLYNQNVCSYCINRIRTYEWDL